jgi:hypothetical protein
MRHNPITAALFFALLTVTQINPARADTAPATPGTPHLVIALDGTGSLLLPSPINPRVSQQAVLLSIVPDLLSITRTRWSEANLELFVICDTPILAHNGPIKRSRMAEINKNVGLSTQDCKAPGTRIDLTLHGIGELVQLESGPYVVALMTDGINETANGLALEQGYKALQHLRKRPPVVFAMIGVNDRVRLAWELAARRAFQNTKTAVVIGSNRDIQATLTRIKQAMATR